MYLKQKGNLCGLYSYYNLANELHLPTRAEIRRILSERELCVANYRFYPGQGLYPEQLAMVISEHLPKGYDAHLISNDWNLPAQLQRQRGQEAPGKDSPPQGLVPGDACEAPGEELSRADAEVEMEDHHRADHP